MCLLKSGAVKTDINENLCRGCGITSMNSSVSSFGFCQNCEESNFKEIEKLKKTKRIFGLISGVIYLTLFFSFFIPLLMGTNSFGDYVLRGHGAMSHDMTMSFQGILILAILTFTAGTVFLAIYFHLRRKLNKKNAESYPISGQKSS